MNFKRVLSNYSIGNIKEIGKNNLSTNPLNRTREIITESIEKYLLKLIGTEDREKVDNEIKSILFFEKKGLLPEGFLVRTKNGRIGVKTQKGFFILTKYAGKKINSVFREKLGKSMITKIAKRIAEMHKITSYLDISQKEDAFLYLVSELKHYASLADVPDDIKSRILREVSKFNNINKFMPKTTIHGDIQQCNILVKDSSLYFIDFELVRKANRVMDLHKLIIELCLKKGFVFDYDTLKFFLDSCPEDLGKSEIILLYYCIKLEVYTEFFKNIVKGRAAYDQFDIEKMMNFIEKEKMLDVLGFN